MASEGDPLMEIKRGIPVSPGISIAEVLVLDSEEIRITALHSQSEVEAEEIRTVLREAVIDSNRLLEKEIQQLEGEVEIHARILSVHRDLAADPTLHAEGFIRQYENSASLLSMLSVRS